MLPELVVIETTVFLGVCTTHELFLVHLIEKDMLLPSEIHLALTLPMDLIGDL